MALKYKDFEQALGRLEQIVGKLEQGDLPLEASLQLFEEGIEISQFCGKKLDEAERKVEILIKSGRGGLKPRPFEPEESEAD